MSEWGDDERVMSVGELRVLIADLPEDDPIFVDGYEGGFSMPRLEQHHLTTLEPWVDSRGHCGAWSEDYKGQGPKVWVLARDGR